MYISSKKQATTHKKPQQKTNLDVAKKKKKGNLKRENESLLIAAQNNPIRTDYIKAKIVKTQQNNRYWLCGDREETINHIIS